MTRLTLLLALCLTPAFSRAPYGSASVRALQRVVDGDTFLVSLWGWPSVVGDSILVRVAGIDTPELRGVDSAQGRRAREYARVLLTRGPITLHGIRRDKYFRLLADIHVGGVSVGEELIKAGLARPYAGGKK